MQRHTTLPVCFLTFITLSITWTRAQYRVGPIYPDKPNQVATPSQAQSGYDPFQLNSRTGRFEYVPIPYDNEPAGSGYSPFKFNWHSGQWDYVPVAPVQPAYGRIAREPVAAGNFIDTRITPQNLDNGASRGGAGGEAQTARVILPPEPQASPAPPTTPSTQPSTAPVKPANHSQPPGPPPAMRVKLAGHWQYDYNSGKWVFVLPGD